MTQRQNPVPNPTRGLRCCDLDVQVGIFVEVKEEMIAAASFYSFLIGIFMLFIVGRFLVFRVHVLTEKATHLLPTTTTTATLKQRRLFRFSSLVRESSAKIRTLPTLVDRSYPFNSSEIDITYNTLLT